MTYVHQNSKQPPSQFTPLDTKLMTLVLVNLHVYLCVYKCIYCMCGNCKHLCLPIYMYMYPFFVFVHVHSAIYMYPFSVFVHENSCASKQAATMASLKLEQPLWLRKIISHNGLEK